MHIMSDRSPKSKRRHRPNKEHFLIQKKILILLFVNEKGLINKNKIYNEIARIGKEEKQTGLRYKPNVLDSIGALGEIGLIEVKEEGAQKEIVILTQIGKELAEIIITLENYNAAYFHLVESLHKKVSFIPSRVLSFIGYGLDEINSLDPKEFRDEITAMKFKLIEIGWSKVEIALYNQILTNLIDFKDICDKNFMNMLLPRYSKIIKDHNKNPFLLKLLNYLIKESVEKRIDFILENHESEIYGYSVIRTIYPNDNKHAIEIRGSTGGVHEYFSSLFSIFYNNAITFVLEKELENMIIAYLELLQPPLGGESFLIDDLEELIARCNNSLQADQQLSKIQKEKIELIRRTASFFRKILFGYAEKKNMHIITFPH